MIRRLVCQFVLVLVWGMGLKLIRIILPNIVWHSVRLVILVLMELIDVSRNARNQNMVITSEESALIF